MGQARNHANAAAEAFLAQQLEASHDEPLRIELVQNAADLSLGRLGRSAFPKAPGYCRRDRGRIVAAVAVGEDESVQEVDRAEALLGTGHA
jgi:hypothetical protein